MSVSPAYLAALACMMEVTAPKPGNVYPGRPFRYINVSSFSASALALLQAWNPAPPSLGLLVERAVTATAELVGRNTNLGIILLLAPLVLAANRGRPDREALGNLLDELDEDDALRVYRSIRLASPEGLGSSDRYDVEGDAPPLMLAMRYASSWDSVALEYATCYDLTYRLTVPLLESLWREGHSLCDCVVAAYVELLAKVPDTLIVRRLGRQAAAEVSSRAAEILAAGGPLSAEGARKRYEFECWLARPDNAMNPGTTADLIACALYVFLSRRTEGLAAVLDRWEDCQGG